MTTDQTEPLITPDPPLDPLVAAIDLEGALNAAMAGERYLVAVFRVADGQVHLHRESKAFPPGDLPVALELLRHDFATLEPGGTEYEDSA